jgi:hypothetical protein
MLLKTRPSLLVNIVVTDCLTVRSPLLDINLQRL